MSYQLTDKSKDLIKTKQVDGAKFALCDVVNGKELWIALPDESPPHCSRCGYQGTALQRHHVYGRKVSEETILLCANCHVEIHKGAI
jgi:hypothetical protein